MEIDERLQSDLSGNVVVALGRRELFGEVVVRGHIGVVVLGVVELHDLTGDGGLKGAIVV